MSVEQRKFSVSPSIITHLIKAQAGSLGKAASEAVMNGIDAGATRIDITVSSTRMVIADDGVGMQTREEIEQCFEVFGWDHADVSRQFGKFGLGRGQLWNFASTIWRTGTFALDVDVRERGLDWRMVSALEPVAGLTIEATFYEAMTAVELFDFERELATIVKYSAVPIYLNGKAISKDPATCGGWTAETEDAYIKVAEGGYLTVYNQGLFVSRSYAGQSGISGVICTKRGRNLELNMARNDVLRASCPIWKRLNAVCTKLALDLLGKQRKKRMTDADRDFLAQASADPGKTDLLDQPIFTLCNNKHVAFKRLMADCFGWDAMPLTVAESGSRMGERLITDGSALVLSERTLARFGVDTVRALVDLLAQRMNDSHSREWNTQGDNLSYRLHQGSITVHERIEQCPGWRQLNASKITADKLSRTQKHFLAAVSTMFHGIAAAFRAARQRPIARREVIVGIAEGVDAYTDGASYIAFTDVTVDEVARQGLDGWIRVAQLLVHEYLHDSDDSGSHTHDGEFYEAFHDIVLDGSSRIVGAAGAAFRIFAGRQEKLTRQAAKDIDRLAKNPAADAAASFPRAASNSEAAGRLACAG